MQLPQSAVDVAIAAKMRQLSHLVGGADDVKRDMELVRKILRTIIDKNDLQARELRLDGYGEEMLGSHVEMLYDAGYLKGVAIPLASNHYTTILVSTLTWEGHEFAGALLTDEATWDKVKAAFGPEQLAIAPLKMIGSVATAALTAWAMQRLGL